MKDQLKSILRASWNEPRRFFAWLTLFSLAALAAEYCAIINYSHHIRLLEIGVAPTAVLLASFVIGLVCMVLAWIPPVRRLLAWLLQRRLFVLACLVTLVALFYAEEDWRGKRAWDNYRHQWEAKGEHFDFASIVPPPVPDDQNFALTPIVYGTYGSQLDRHGHRISPSDTNVVDRLDMSVYRGEDYGDTNLNLGAWQKNDFANLKPWQDYYRHPKAGLAKPDATPTNEFPTSASPQSPAADVLLALSKYDSAIGELREAAKLPYSRFPLEYSQNKPFGIILPHLSKIKGVARVLDLRAIAELEASQPDKALADLDLAFRWNDSIRTEPFVIDHLVRIAVQSMIMQPIWQGLASHEWTDEQIAELENELGKEDYLADFHQAMRGERAASIATVDVLRRNRNSGLLRELDEEVSNDAGERGPESCLEMLADVAYDLIPDGWFYQTELTFAEMHQRWVLPTVDLSKRVASPSLNRQLSNEGLKALELNSAKNILVRMLFPNLGRAAERFAVIQAQVDLARTGCALERYRLAHGSYPNSLNPLAPQFTAQVPHDLINGQPLHYRLTSDGYVLYSVGWNEKDDGGVVVLTKGGAVNPEQGDWVWQMPGKTQ